MAILKYDEQSIIGRQDAISRRKQYRDRLIILKDHKEDVFWKTLKEHLKLMVESEGSRIDLELHNDTSDVPASYASLRFHYGGKKCAQEIIDSVDNSDALLDRVQEDIAKRESELKNIREENQNGE